MLDYIGSLVFATGKPAGFRTSPSESRHAIICALALVLLLGAATFAVVGFGEIGTEVSEALRRAWQSG
jgi:hypothetical protein